VRAEVPDRRGVRELGAHGRGIGGVGELHLEVGLGCRDLERPTDERAGVPGRVVGDPERPRALGVLAVEGGEARAGDLAVAVRGVALRLERPCERGVGAVVVHPGARRIVVEDGEISRAVCGAAAVVGTRAVVGGELDRRPGMDELEVEVRRLRVHDPNRDVDVDDLGVRKPGHRRDV
jgi:hypothetical protein